MFAIRLMVVLICIAHQANDVTGRIVCEDAKVAQTQLESYYRWWYRLYYSIFFFTRVNDVCSLEDDDRQRICAEVAQACIPEVRNVALDEIRREIQEVGICDKRIFRVRLENCDLWSTEKRMYRCEKFNAAGIAVKGFYVSNGGRAGTVLIFKEPPGHLKEYVNITNMVSGLGLSPWADA